MIKKISVKGYIIHIDLESGFVKFQVYPVFGDQYIDKENDPDTRDFEEGKCLMKLEGSYCWRGLWESRLYFPDDEYWGEELEELSNIYNNTIIPYCQKLLKKNNKHILYEIQKFGE